MHTEVGALTELDRELEAHHLEGHWRLPPSAIAPVPEPVAQPYLWPWSVVRRLLVAAGEAHEIEGGASRRTVRLCTPGMRTKWTTPNVHASVQLVKPGEVAAAHRHSMGAFRFVLEGTGGYTTVNGEKLAMAPGDLVLTPQSSWHDHGHEGGEPMIWIDVHDFPFVEHLNTILFEAFRQRQQDVGFVGDRSHYVYRGADMLPHVRSLGDDAYDPRRGFTLEYRNPQTDGPVLPTIGCRLQRLPAGAQTRRHRRSPNVIYHVVEGSGTTAAGDATLSWTAGDLFVVPGWTWEVHRASADAILFAISDEPIYHAFDLYRCEE